MNLFAPPFYVDAAGADKKHRVIPVAVVRPIRAPGPDSDHNDKPCLENPVPPILPLRPFNRGQHHVAAALTYLIQFFIRGLSLAW
jgi:hypothetical protein